VVVLCGAAFLATGSCWLRTSSSPRSSFAQGGVWPSPSPGRRDGGLRRAGWAWRRWLGGLRLVGVLPGADACRPPPRAAAAQVAHPVGQFATFISRASPTRPGPGPPRTGPSFANASRWAEFAAIRSPVSVFTWSAVAPLPDRPLCRFDLLARCPGQLASSRGTGSSCDRGSSPRWIVLCHAPGRGRPRPCGRHVGTAERRWGVMAMVEQRRRRRGRRGPVGGRPGHGGTVNLDRSLSCEIRDQGGFHGRLRDGTC
jgi:hypothetical protein